MPWVEKIIPTIYLDLRGQVSERAGIKFIRAEVNMPFARVTIEIDGKEQTLRLDTDKNIDTIQGTFGVFIDRLDDENLDRALAEAAKEICALIAVEATRRQSRLSANFIEGVNRGLALIPEKQQKTTKQMN